MKLGSTAPQFSLTDKDGKLHSLSKLPGDFTVLYFYPKDDTPGCTIQAQEFSKALPKFAKLKATVVGISGGNDVTKGKFCTKYKLKVLLLSDPDFKLAKKFKSYGKKSFMGRTFNGIFRNTYILDSAKRVIATFEKVDPATNSAEMLEFIKSHSSQKSSAKKATAKSQVSKSPATKKTASVKPAKSVAKPSASKIAKSGGSKMGGTKMAGTKAGKAKSSAKPAAAANVRKKLKPLRASR